jgi:cell division protein ZapB
LPLERTALSVITLVATMTETHLPPALKDFEDKLDLLIHHYRDVKAENSTLKINQASLLLEKAELLAQTTAARARVEAMVARLKAMGQGS